MVSPMTDGINWIDGDDHEMAEACARARATFRFFWREMTWEMRRIIPGLELAVVKLAFSEERKPGLLRGLFGGGKSGEPIVEHMWISDVQFDGVTVRGTLLNDPHELRSVSAGDSVIAPFEQVTDWMYVMRDEVYGGFTIDVVRGEMPDDARAQHDDAWGLNFGSVGDVPYTPFEDDETEHPMSINMGSKFAEAIAANPEMITQGDAGGTMLHDMALGGSETIVEALLAAGADPMAERADGKTPADLAELVGWTTLARRLRIH